MKLIVSGYLNRIAIYIDDWIDNFTLSILLDEFSKLGFNYDSNQRVWFKDSENIDEDLNDLEDLLREFRIPFEVKHTQYTPLKDFC